MSDGPHRSLPMRPAWRRVAERGDRPAYTPREISDALVPALEQDCRSELTSEFLAGVRRVVQEPSLFKDDVAARLESLRPLAGSGIGRAVLENVGPLSVGEADAFGVVKDALAAALLDRANRGARQVEEHFLRKASAPRAGDVRGRLEKAIGGTDLDAIAGRVLRADPKRKLGAPAKQKGLDDGVDLP
jgi:hypothetical protein